MSSSCLRAGADRKTRGPQPGTVEPTVRPKVIVPETIDDGLKRRRAGFHQLAGNEVGVEHRGTKGCEDRAGRRLARADAAGQRHQEGHGEPMKPR